MTRKNVGASVRARLLNKARTEKLDFNLLLTRYALERISPLYGRRREAGRPVGLTDEFAQDTQKARQWQAFLRKNALDSVPLATVVDDLRNFLAPVLAAVASGAAPGQRWRAGDGWQMSSR